MRSKLQELIKAQQELVKEIDILWLEGVDKLKGTSKDKTNMDSYLRQASKKGNETVMKLSKARGFVIMREL